MNSLYSNQALADMRLTRPPDVGTAYEVLWGHTSASSNCHQIIRFVIEAGIPSSRFFRMKDWR